MPSGRKHYRITFADALSAHKRALSFGGVDGIPNPGLIESAIARPYSGYYRSIEKKTAALVQSIASNHGFADGNKRTALILTHTLLTKSGYRLVPAEKGESLDAAAEEMILSAVTHALAFDDIVAWFRRRVERT